MRLSKRMTGNPYSGIIRKLGNSDISAVGNGTVTSAISELKTNTDANTENIKIQTERIDNLSAIEQGSTTGDAELMDIRVKVNGDTAITAGEAVRSQIQYINSVMMLKYNDLSEKIQKIQDGGIEVSDLVIAQQVSIWLDDHPEATTTIKDNSIDPKKMSNKFWADERLGLCSVPVKKVDIEL